MEDAARQVLILSDVLVMDGVVVGPGATVAPFTAAAVTLTDCLPALTSSQMLPEDCASISDQYVWQPRIPVSGQLIGMFISLLVSATLIRAPMGRPQVL
jgi:hypothetical protein